MTEPKPGLGLTSTLLGRATKTKAPVKVEPEQSKKHVRTLPDNQILIQPSRKLLRSDLPKTITIKKDTHMAIKQIASVEDKKIYDVVDEIVETYIKNMSDSSKKVILNAVREVQKNMTDMQESNSSLFLQY